MADHREVYDMFLTLERGTKMVVFSRTKKAETKLFQVKLDTRELVWYRGSGAKADGKTDLRLIKEVRAGKNAREFERSSEEAFRYDSSLCLVILYGDSFKLMTLALAVTTVADRDTWVKGLSCLIEDTKSASYPVKVDRWLRKEFYGIESQGKVNIKDLKPWLLVVDFKLSKCKIQDLIQLQHDQKDVNFEEFSAFYKNLMFLPSDIFKADFGKYLDPRENVTLDLFKQFLLREQKEPVGNDSEAVKCIMREFMDKPQQDHSISKHAFLNYLFSEQNSIWDSRHSQVNQDMNQPITSYWIASSHNTYLTGDQIRSDSSTEAYARVLRSGCRCIELDCWDGPDEYPHIYHGHTLTSRIRFLDVLKTIKENAFVASDYPVILSIENHCSLPQQISMAYGFKDVFGDLLITTPLATNETALPSPNQLKKKIIIKHKKLRTQSGSSEMMLTPDKSSKDDGNFDISNCLKTGILSLRDPYDETWKPYVFVLTTSALHYTEKTEIEDDEEEKEGKVRRKDSLLMTEVPQELNDEDQHETEVWFHGVINRNDAQKILMDNVQLGNGAFLVRRGDTYKGEFTLSFLHNKLANHCRIQRDQYGDKFKYKLTEKYFDNLKELIKHHQKHPLISKGFSQVLTYPVPVKAAHVDEPWFYQKISRDETEDKLSRLPVDGVFLIRQRATGSHDEGPSQFALSFRAERKVKHCRIEQRARAFIIGDSVFRNLCDLVEYYQKHPLYRKIKLTYPLTNKLLEKWGSTRDNDAIYKTGVYASPNSLDVKTRVRALYDYEAEKDDELSFCKNAIITDVLKDDGDWWRGTYGGKVNGWFPVQFVEELDSTGIQEGLFPLEKGTIDLTANGTAVSRLRKDNTPMFRISFQNAPTRDIAATSEEDLEQWMKALNECISNVSKFNKERKLAETIMKIAKELSDLIVYCIPSPMDIDKAVLGKFSYTEMFSMAETQLARLLTKERSPNLVCLSTRHFVRIYPKGQRIDSSNYDPALMWNSGCQLIALNYQTPDLAMQLNDGLFSMNGKCGYVLKPECMTRSGFNPFDKHSLSGVDPLTITLTIIGARHLSKSGRSTACCFAEVEIIGCSYDSKNKYKTGTKVDNGLNPVWNDQCVFDVINPEMAMIRFSVQDLDMFGDSNLLGQAVYPIKCLKAGYRSIQLKNDYSEPLELGALLVHITVTNPKNEENENYTAIQKLRDQMDLLQEQMESCKSDHRDVEIRKMEQQQAMNQGMLFERNALRNKRRGMVEA